MDSELRVLFVGYSEQKRLQDQPPPRLESELIDAVACHRVTVHFQPQFEVQSGRGFGVEALARWCGLDGAQIPPSIFIPLAERIGLIRDLGISVLQQACDAVSGWRETGETATTLSVNVSTLQITEDFCTTVADIVELSGLPPERLELEITESQLIGDTELAVECLGRIRRLGVRIAIDDFGTGYSSLSYLARLPVDRLKLDMSFIHRMLFEKRTAAIVRSVLALGKEMGVTVLAEGIESERQFEMLESLGCQQVQGRLFATAMPAKEARALLTAPWGARPMQSLRSNCVISRGLHAA